jgi:His Kinase A (phospho-acceptor) domain
MAGTRNATGFARNLLIALAIVLIGGVAGSFWMGIRAKDAVITSTVSQVQTIADNSLTLVFKPADLSGPASDERAAALRDQVAASVLDTSPFTAVTLWSQDGHILFSSDVGRIGTSLPGMRDRIKSAIKGDAQTQDIDGSFSVMAPFQLPSGVGNPAAIELTRPDDPIAAAPGPWRTNALFLVFMLVIVGFLLVRMQRLGDAIATHMSFTKPKGGSQPSPVLAISQPRATLEAPTPGIREEAEARRRAEDRARSSEDRLEVLQEQYRKTLEELHASQLAAREMPQAFRSDPKLEQRALKAEGRARTLEGQVLALQSERDKIMKDLLELSAETKPLTDPEELARLQQVEQDSIGLQAELEGAQTQLAIARREAEALAAQSARASELQEDLDAAHVDALHSRESAESAQAELGAAQTELDDARAELRVLRNEEQRAVMLDDELRTARAELEGAAAAHRSELVQLEADLEAKVRATREEFQAQLTSIESSYRDQLGEREADLADRIVAAEHQTRIAADELELAKASIRSAREESAALSEQLAAEVEQHVSTVTELERVRLELAERQHHVDAAGGQIENAREEAEALGAKLLKANEELATIRDQYAGQTARADELSTALAEADREAKEATSRSYALATQLEDAGQDNADLNRRLQELEARRALEVAGSQGRADLDEILKVTQERLSGQTEKLIHAEDRVHELEREVAGAADRLEEVEAELRQQHMAEAMRQLRETHEQPTATADGSDSDGVPTEDRRAASPFLKELSHDAKKSLSQILGVTQILKHQKDAKEQSQLIKQLTSQARRLDHTITDLVDADRLARGTVELTVKRTDLQALVERVVEESGVKAEHEVRVITEALIVGVDQRRTEQVLAGLLRASGDRTARGKEITVKLAHVDGGAMIFVEDPEPASEGSLSPVVRRFAEVQGGWARVEARDGGGSSFRVFLPDGGPAGPDGRADDVRRGAAGAGGDEVQIVEEEPWDPSAEQILVQELHRLSERTAKD